ncbi:hypothetical protein GCM10010269_11240 [Streptomyces humidus]|uniref:Helix-turn-helix domain-containing protein n=1 Tax=Streptomyces humidus TaxID=52259 RepID=A0A918L1Q6_9ACTN|nr:hypothetical protein GCM10010269_11240 [Streptomyces humidus]
MIGNHLAQHPDLSGLAIGLAVHIQSLPAGARVDIKTLAARFPEGPTRTAAALRELETHGYLRPPPRTHRERPHRHPHGLLQPARPTRQRTGRGTRTPGPPSSGGPTAETRPPRPPRRTAARVQPDERPEPHHGQLPA